MIKNFCANCGKGIDKGIPDQSWTTVNRSSFYEHDGEKEKKIPAKHVLLCEDCSRYLKLNDKKFYIRIGKFLK